MLSTPTFRRLAALAEVLTILILGNLVGLGLYRLFEPPSLADGTASPELAAFAEGLLILLRLGSAALFGYALLYYRRGLTPRDAGLTRARLPLGRHLSVGFALGVFTSTPLVLLFAAYELTPFGEGLSAWWTYKDRPLNLAFWISLLGTGVLVPPLVEEIFTRGYQRARLVESYGVMGGVALTGLVFAVAHTRYLTADPLLLAFLLTLLISSLSWTYLAQKTGSVIPAIVAHAFTNATGTAVLFNVWVPLVIILLAAILLHRPIVATLKTFVADWRADADLSGLWTGLAGLMGILLIGLALLPLLGRVPTLATLGALLVVLTALQVYAEKARPSA